MKDKKASQRKLKEEKQAAAKRKERLTGFLLKSGGLIIALLAVVVFYQGLFGGPPSLPPEEVGAMDHIRGNADAAVTLTVYGDFECPSCRTETEVLARAWPQIGNEIRLVFRHYPLDVHRHAFLAARYAEAAARQERFWEMHDILYANQELWAGIDDPLPLFDGFARDIDLDLEQLKLDIELPEIRAKILSDQRGGTRAGVRGTPTLFLNGDLLNTPRTTSELIQAIRSTASG